MQEQQSVKQVWLHLHRLVGVHETPYGLHFSQQNVTSPEMAAGKVASAIWQECCIYNDWKSGA